VTSVQPEAKGLQRRLGPIDAAAIVISNVIGGGIFFVPVIVAQLVPRPSALLTYKITAGYTGDPPQSRADILKNSHFQDVRVHIFAKHSSSQWIEIGQFDLPRQLITQ